MDPNAIPSRIPAWKRPATPQAWQDELKAFDAAGIYPVDYTSGKQKGNSAFIGIWVVCLFMTFTIDLVFGVFAIWPLIPIGLGLWWCVVARRDRAKELASFWNDPQVMRRTLLSEAPGRFQGTGDNRDAYAAMLTLRQSPVPVLMGDVEDFARRYRLARPDDTADEFIWVYMSGLMLLTAMFFLSYAPYAR